MRTLIVAVTAALLAGCAAVLPQGPDRPTTTYVLDPDRPLAGTTRSGPTLLIPPASAAPGYGTPRMAYLKERYRIDYYAHNEWVAAPASMLGPVLVATLRESGHFAGVVDDRRGTLADLRLDLRLDRMHQDFRSQPSQGSVALTVSLFDLADGGLLATRVFEASEPAPSDDAQGGVIAINRALARLLPEISAFAADQATRAARSPRP
jgi:cholesterol transport system auxiliary component